MPAWAVLQSELRQLFLKLTEEPFGIGPVLESGYQIVGVADHNHVPLRHFLAPHFNPQIEHIMQIHVGRQRRYGRSLCAVPSSPPRPLLQHLRLQMEILDRIDVCYSETRRLLYETTKVNDDAAVFRGSRRNVRNPARPGGITREDQEGGWHHSPI